MAAAAVTMSQFVHEFPGPSQRLICPVPVGDSERLVRRVGEVFAALAPVMRPLVVAVELAVFDQEIGIVDHEVAVSARRRALVAMHDPAPLVRLPEVTCDVPAIDATQLADWLLAQLATQDGLGLVELTTPASEARVASRAAATLMARPGTVVMPIREEAGALWVRGPVPVAPGQPPIRVTLHHDVRVLQLTVGVEWSWWSEGPGRVDVDVAVERLLARDWQR